MKIKWILICSCLLFLAVSCSKKGYDMGVSSYPITFEGSYETELKGSEITTGNIPSFGVFAALEDDVEGGFDDLDVDRLQLFMDDVPVRKTSAGWLADPVHYWPVLDDKHISFFAYAPHSAGTGIVADAGWGGTEEKSKIVSVSYTMDADPARHVDLCVAQAVLDRVKDVDSDGIIDPVEFRFKHTLSSVSFAANYVGDVPDGCYLRIDELSISNFIRSNVIAYNSDAEDFFEWNEITDETPRDGVVMLNIGRSTLSSSAKIVKTDAAGTGEYTDFLTLNGVIYMIPQVINPVGTDTSELTTIDVTFSYVKDDLSNSVIAQFYTSMDLPMETQDSKIVLDTAKKYKFLFTLDVTNASLVDISCMAVGDWLVDWVDSGNGHEDTLIK